VSPRTATRENGASQAARDWTRVDRDSAFIFYVFGDEGIAREQLGRIDSSRSAVVLVQTSEDQVLFDAYLLDVNQARHASGLNSIILIDFR